MEFASNYAVKPNPIVCLSARKIQWSTLKIQDINFLQTAVFMFRHKSNIIPLYFKNMFRQNRDIHSYPTRHACNIHLTNPRTLLSHKSIRHSGPDVWNSLSPQIRGISSARLFKKSVKTLLFAQYHHDQWHPLISDLPSSHYNFLVDTLTTIYLRIKSIGVMPINVHCIKYLKKS